MNTSVTNRAYNLVCTKYAHKSNADVYSIDFQVCASVVKTALQAGGHRFESYCSHREATDNVAFFISIPQVETIGNQGIDTKSAKLLQKSTHIFLSHFCHLKCTNFEKSMRKVCALFCAHHKTIYIVFLPVSIYQLPHTTKKGGYLWHL